MEDEAQQVQTVETVEDAGTDVVENNEQASEVTTNSEPNDTTEENAARKEEEEMKDAGDEEAQNNTEEREVENLLKKSDNGGENEEDDLFAEEDDETEEKTPKKKRLHKKSDSTKKSKRNKTTDEDNAEEEKEGEGRRRKKREVQFEESDEEQPTKEKKKRKKSKEEKKKRKKRSSRSSREESALDNDDAPNENQDNFVSEDIPEAEEDPDAESYIQQADEFDTLIESLKKGRGSRRKKDLSEVEQLGQVEAAADFIVKMNKAAEDDINANMDKRPALAKIKMLNEVVQQLEKKNLQQLFIDEHILKTLKIWLQPLPDGSLPNMKVRETILNLLSQFPSVDVDELKDSEIGKVVVFLWKHPTETIQNKKIAKSLIERWSRPIFGASEKYQDSKREDEPIQPYPEMQRRDSSSSLRDSAPRSSDLTSELDRKLKSSKAAPSFHASIPEKIALDFKIQPKSSLDVEKAKKRSGSKLMSKFEKTFSKLKTPAKNARAANLSIEGRRLETRL